MKDIETFARLRTFLIRTNNHISCKIEELYQGHDPAKDFSLEILFRVKNNFTLIIAKLTIEKYESPYKALEQKKEEIRNLIVGNILACKMPDVVTFLDEEFSKIQKFFDEEEGNHLETFGVFKPSSHYVDVMKTIPESSNDCG